MEAKPDIQQVQDMAEKVRVHVQNIIVGKDEVISLALVALLCHGHILIEDVPGVGKTALARALAGSISCRFKRIQCTPDLLPSDVTGMNIFDREKNEFEFKHGPLFANVVLADEINRTTPRTQSALLEAMNDFQITVERPGHAKMAQRHQCAGGAAAELHCLRVERRLQFHGGAAAAG